MGLTTTGADHQQFAVGRLADRRPAAVAVSRTDHSGVEYLDRIGGYRAGPGQADRQQQARQTKPAQRQTGGLPDRPVASMTHPHDTLRRLSGKIAPKHQSDLLPCPTGLAPDDRKKHSTTPSAPSRLPDWRARCRRGGSDS